MEPAYVRRPPDVEVEVEAAIITDPLTVQVADLFSAVYETTLQALSRYFVHTGETPEQVTTLATVAKHLLGCTAPAPSPGSAMAWVHGINPIQKEAGGAARACLNRREIREAARCTARSPGAGRG